MGFTSAWHWIIVLLVIVIVFGAGKLPTVMGDLAKGIKTFKSTMRDDETAEAVLPGSRAADERTPAESR
jgi:sec-independent protein translocase protein TatA